VLFCPFSVKNRLICSISRSFSISFRDVKTVSPCSKRLYFARVYPSFWLICSCVYPSFFLCCFIFVRTRITFSANIVNFCEFCTHCYYILIDRQKKAPMISGGVLACGFNLIRMLRTIAQLVVRISLGVCCIA